MITLLLILHGLVAVALIGAVTHQAVAVCWPTKPAQGFADRFRGVSGPTYTIAVIVLFISTFLLGSIIYPAYRLGVRNYLISFRLLRPEGAFEIKEHFAAIGLGLLPVYWLLWSRHVQGYERVRSLVTVVLAVIVWVAFLIGHILNNIRGLYGA